jgi:hypothetical protein
MASVPSTLCRHSGPLHWEGDAIDIQVGGFSLCTPVSSTNETGLHDITEILLKVALNTINQPVFNYKEDFLI